VATKIAAHSKNQEISNMIVTVFKPKIKHYDLGFFGLIESITLAILDNYDQTNLVLVTDSLYYIPILKMKKLMLQLKT
jgi:hypothetical protein